MSAVSQRAGGAVVDPGARHDRLLPWIAAERTVRAVLLVAVGLVLITHLHTNWGHSVQTFVRHFGFDPSENAFKRLTASAARLTPTKIRLYGLVAIAYGALEGCEGYGLWRRRRWGEWLTVVATSLLFIPEIDEMIKKPTVLKGLALIVNALIVAYLIWRLRRRASPAGA